MGRKNEMRKPVIQSLWIGKELTLLEQLSIASFLFHGHAFHLYAYDDIAHVPEGTQLKDAGEILPEKNIFAYNGGSYAIFADWFRWALLYKKGHFWVDTDVICLKPFEFDTDIVFGLESDNLVASGVLGFPPGHELCALLENCCKNPNRFLPYDSWKTKKKKLKRKILGKGRSDIGWGEAGGPKGFTEALKYFNLMDFAKPFTYFYPVHWSNWNAVFDETLSEDLDLFSDTHSIHLWNEMIRRRKGFDKNAAFPQKSLFEQLKRRYLQPSG